MDNNQKMVNSLTKVLKNAESKYGKESKEYQDAVQALQKGQAELEQAKKDFVKEQAEEEQAKNVRDKESQDVVDQEGVVKNEKQDAVEAQEAYKIAKNTCGTCKKDYNFNDRLQPAVQRLRQKNNEWYMTVTSQIQPNDYDGIFNDDMDNKPPGLQRISCYIGFEKSQMSITSEYGYESIGYPFDYFKEAYLSGSGRDYKVIIDVIENDKRLYFPELYKLRLDSRRECCMESCKLLDEYQYELNIEQVKTLSEELKIAVEKTLKFQDQFNEEYLDRIHNFVKSTSTYYRISDYCAKIVKAIRFIDFVGDKQINLGVNGQLESYYEENKLKNNKVGIYNGYFSDALQSFITFDRQCIINKVFGRGLYQ